MKHERRVVGHVSGRQEQMDTCVCGKQWPCPELPPSNQQLRTCPDCRNQFVQPFVCITCGAQKLYDETVRSQAAEIQRLNELVADHEEVHRDHRRLVRELDVLLNGEAGAAKQASLCDIVCQLAHQKRSAHETPVGLYRTAHASTCALMNKSGAACDCTEPFRLELAGKKAYVEQREDGDPYWDDLTDAQRQRWVDRATLKTTTGTTDGEGA